MNVNQRAANNVPTTDIAVFGTITLKSLLSLNYENNLCNAQVMLTSVTKLKQNALRIMVMPDPR